MKLNSTVISAIIVFILIVVFSNILLINKVVSKKGENVQESLETIEVYNPQINPADFTTKITNKYLTFEKGKTYVYEGRTEEGLERVEVTLTDNLKSILGVTVAEVRDKDYLNGELIEDTRDWFAQDKFGNVWYFGEDSKDIVDGKIVSRKGSWVAGIYGAKPGIVMLGNPTVGQIYRQEYYPGEAEDMGEVVALGVQIKVKQGSFSDCLQTKDWNPLESDSEEYKYYCPAVKGLVYEFSIEDKGGLQLVDIKEGSTKTAAVIEEPLPELKTDITESEAIAIARNRVNGDVTDVEIEKKFGKTTYVVEIADGGDEIDVIIDIETGQVLGVED
jgi:uncharacterized membrane protein YkoI